MAKANRDEMIKRILEIITFPFYLLFQFVFFPFKILKIVIDDKRDRKKSNSEINSKKNVDLKELGKLLFPNHIWTEFEVFFNPFLSDKKRFISVNKDLLAAYDDFELDKLKAIEVIYIFGDSRQKLWITDWCGEENEREIEYFLEDKLQIKSNWTNVNKLRKITDEGKQRDGKFIIDLLKAIDRDLEVLNKRLIFFDLEWDAYVYTVVEQALYKTIIAKFGILFHGTGKLRH